MPKLDDWTENMDPEINIHCVNLCRMHKHYGPDYLTGYLANLQESRHVNVKANLVLNIE